MNLQRDLSLDARSWWTRCAQLPGFVDVNSDMQIASPQVMVDIDRDRALALGVTPQQIQNALFSGVRPAARSRPSTRRPTNTR